MPNISLFCELDHYMISLYLQNRRTFIARPYGFGKSLMLDTIGTLLAVLDGSHLGEGGLDGLVAHTVASHRVHIHTVKRTNLLAHCTFGSCSSAIGSKSISGLMM